MGVDSSEVEPQIRLRRGKSDLGGKLIGERPESRFCLGKRRNHPPLSLAAMLLEAMHEFAVQIALSDNVTDACGQRGLVL